VFPILGGRLLKKKLFIQHNRGEMFPILGGRLLKRLWCTDKNGKQIVSNPWREAIEVEVALKYSVLEESFQSLEGGY